MILNVLAEPEVLAYIPTIFYGQCILLKLKFIIRTRIVAILPLFFFTAKPHQI